MYIANVPFAFRFFSDVPEDGSVTFTVVTVCK